MLPRHSLNRKPHCDDRDIKILADSSQGFSGIVALSHQANVMLGKFGAAVEDSNSPRFWAGVGSTAKAARKFFRVAAGMVIVSARCPPLSSLVGVIVSHRTRKEMRWVAARRVVAMMAGHQFTRVLAHAQMQRDSVRIESTAGRFVKEQSVSVTLAALPFPATVWAWLKYVAPKSSLLGGRKGRELSNIVSAHLISFSDQVEWPLQCLRTGRPFYFIDALGVM